jgi:hypothetical protein
MELLAVASSCAALFFSRDFLLLAGQKVWNFTQISRANGLPAPNRYTARKIKEVQIKK